MTPEQKCERLRETLTQANKDLAYYKAKSANMQKMLRYLLIVLDGQFPLTATEVKELLKSYDR